MADVARLEKTHEGQGQEPELVRAEEECCVPFCGPETCGLPLAAEGEQGSVRSQPAVRNKLVKLTSAGAQRLFNGEDDEIYSREDLIETQPDGDLTVTGACSGTVWLVRKDEIAAIVDA